MNFYDLSITFNRAAISKLEIPSAAESKIVHQYRTLHTALDKLNGRIEVILVQNLCFYFMLNATACDMRHQISLIFVALIRIFFQAYLKAVHDGSVEVDHALIRRINGITSQLPISQSQVKNSVLIVCCTVLIVFCTVNAGLALHTSPIPDKHI